MKHKFYLITVILSLTSILFSCKNSDDIELSDTDYIIFGHFYGMCVGEECVEIYRLEKSKLFEDTFDKYPTSQDFYDGNYIQLSQNKFEATKDLTDFFPKDLLNEANKVIGEPDAGDWGGLYIEYNFDGVRNFWLLDQMKSNVPDKYHTFFDKVNEKIGLIE